MIETKKAGDLMIPLDSYPHVPYWFSLRQATAIMEKAQYANGPGRPVGGRFVLVFDETYNLVGIVRRRDLLRGLGLDSESGAGADDPASANVEAGGDESPPWDAIAVRIREQAERPISEVMRRIRSTVDHQDNLLKVASTMVEQNVSMLPVLRDGVVIGVIRSAEVFREIASLIL
jgi:CBS domain-containing protein